LQASRGRKPVYGIENVAALDALQGNVVANATKDREAQESPGMAKTPLDCNPVPLKLSIK
jgi:hypothetical protein